VRAPSLCAALPGPEGNGSEEAAGAGNVFILLLLTLLSVITYLDGCGTSVAGPTMRGSWTLAGAVGLGDGAFASHYALFEIPAGPGGRQLRRKNVVTRIVLWCPAGTALTGLTSRFGTLVAGPGSVRHGGSRGVSDISGCIAQWFPRRNGARAQASYGGQPGRRRLGTARDSPSHCLARLREAFWEAGPAGVDLGGGLAPMVSQRPADLPRITARNCWKSMRVGKPGHVTSPGRRIFSNSQVWRILAMFTLCYVWGSMVLSHLVPTYLWKGRGLRKVNGGVCLAPLHHGGHWQSGRRRV